MTYHDHNMHAHPKRSGKKGRSLLRFLVVGAREMTIHPTSPRIKFGTIKDDWKSVGDDLRQAMKQIEACD